VTRLPKWGRRLLGIIIYVVVCGGCTLMYFWFLLTALRIKL
jgi:hypothetical protein